jgi:phosphoribosylanthranilate isomerase
MTRVKVCGITSERDLSVAVDAGVDAVGVVADVPVDTPREVTPERAADLLAAAPPFVTTVLVTMPAAPDSALELCCETAPDALQLHGDLPAGDVAYVAANAGARVVRAVGADEPDRARRQDDVADALLVDTPSADGGGGTGRTHDWDRARDLAADLASPVVLAGGLTPGNVGDAVRTVRPFAVDVASGVEHEDGRGRDPAVEGSARGDAAADGGGDQRKDPEAVSSFVENAKLARVLA